jgi:hypothetical protein
VAHVVVLSLARNQISKLDLRIRVIEPTFTDNSLPCGSRSQREIVRWLTLNSRATSSGESHSAAAGAVVSRADI